MRHNFRELKFWKQSMKLVRDVYKRIEQLPEDEKFGLKNQIRRCSVSIPSNIAEGSGRSTDKDFGNFLNMSLLSSYELEIQLILTNELFEIETKVLIEDLHDLQKMIGGFKRKLSD